MSNTYCIRKKPNIIPTSPDNYDCFSPQPLQVIYVHFFDDNNESRILAAALNINF